MSFRSMFQDVREAMDNVHLSVGAVGPPSPRGVFFWGVVMLRVLGMPSPTRGGFGQPSPSLPQGCLKEKTLENLEKYVVKDVSVRGPHGPPTGPPVPPPC